MLRCATAATHNKKDFRQGLTVVRPKTTSDLCVCEGGEREGGGGGGGSPRPRMNGEARAGEQEEVSVNGKHGIDSEE